jgi:hypothetical protein
VARVVIPVVVDLSHTLARRALLRKNQKSLPRPKPKIERYGDTEATYSMQKRVALNLGGTSTGVVDIVTLEGDEIVRAVQVDAPVVVAVAGRGPGGLAVNKGVGDGHAVVGLRAQDNVLAADAGGLVWLNINMGR